MVELRKKLNETYTGTMEAPFNAKEYRERLKRVKVKMEKEGVDLLYCTSPVSIYYLTGYQSEWYQGEDPGANFPISGVVIRLDSEDVYYFDRCGHEGMANTLTVGENLKSVIHTYWYMEETGINELQFVMNNLKDMKWTKGTVGLELSASRPNAAVSNMMKEAFETEGCTVVNASNIIKEVRTIKSPTEMNYHKVAAQLADIGLSAAYDAIVPGATEMDVKAAAQYAMTKAGSGDTGIPMPVVSGPTRTTMIHALTSQKRIMPGELVMFDACGVYNRYHVNTSRMYSVGKQNAEVTSALQKIDGAVDVLKGILKPGLTVKEYSDTMYKYYKETGIWGNRRMCGGYELGPAFAPSWVGAWTYYVAEECTDERAFEPNTIMNHEVQMYLPDGAGMVLLIDTIYFGENEAYIMSEIPSKTLYVDSFDTTEGILTL